MLEDVIKATVSRTAVSVSSHEPAFKLSISPDSRSLRVTSLSDVPSCSGVALCG